MVSKQVCTLTFILVIQKGQFCFNTHRSKYVKVLETCLETNELQKDCLPEISLVKDKNGNLLAYPHSTLNIVIKFFSQVLNVPGIDDVRYAELHTAEPVVTRA